MQDSQRPSLTAHTEYYWRVSYDPLVVVAWAPSPSSAPGHSVACCPDRDQGTDQASESGLRPSICEVVVQEHVNSLPHHQCCLAWWAAEVPAPATVRLPAARNRLPGGSGYSGLGKLQLDLCGQPGGGLLPGHLLPLSVRCNRVNQTRRPEAPCTQAPRLQGRVQAEDPGLTP